MVVQDYHKTSRETISSEAIYSEAASVVAAGWTLTAFEVGRFPPA